MQVTIGIRETNRELNIEADVDADTIYKLIATSSEKNEPLKLTDKDGKTIIVPSHSLAYVELASAENRRVGFGL